jgi:hypothetical protein
LEEKKLPYQNSTKQNSKLHLFFFCQQELQQTKRKLWQLQNQNPAAAAQNHKTIGRAFTQTLLWHLEVFFQTPQWKDSTLPLKQDSTAYFRGVFSCH